MSSSSSRNSSGSYRCEQCGITFTAIQDKEEHIKLEHEEGQKPAGVS
ncbi:MAG TPA: hypothetical protein VIP70_12425 [Nitrososphaeraceae archaeon]